MEYFDFPKQKDCFDECPESAESKLSKAECSLVGFIYTG